jgi:signal transduction histidine kinase
MAEVVTGAGPGERVGLAGMQERVALLGGTCSICSVPGVGTTVMAEVPLSGPAGGSSHDE